MTVLLIGYLIVAVLLVLIGGIIWLLSIDGDDRRTGARLLFLAPVWFALVVPAIRTLWADAEWGNRIQDRRKNEYHR